MIREYTEDQKEAFLGLARCMHSESRYNKFALNEEKLTKIASNVFCVIAYKDDRPVGTMLGVAQPMWFSNDWVGNEMFVYVTPDHRGGMFAAKMIEKFESYCKKNGCKEINAGSSAQICTEKAKAMYEKMNYNFCGFVANKEL